MFDIRDGLTLMTMNVHDYLVVLADTIAILLLIHSISAK